MVFYRKYRPQKIEELDSEDVRNTLFSVLSKKDSVPHAFLFVGPKGLGKTSAARIVAKIINCEEKSTKSIKSTKNIKSDSSPGTRGTLGTLDTLSTIEPCNKCDQCDSITNGTNLDVLEIDAASNRGIDEIRDLREKIRLSPVSARKKIYIIDEVHMLTTEAFNALLKTLEEPPKHAVFVLCTTEPHKVPETISSRCLYIPFKIATKEELVRSIKRIAKGEKLDVDNDAFDLIASLSGGSFRDGAKILEELSLVSGGKITKETIEQKYQVSSIKYQVLSMITILENKNAKGGLELVSDLVKQGVDIKYFIEQLVEELHSHILKNIGINTGSNIESRLSIEELKLLIELLTKAHGEIKYAVLPQLPLELAIIEWSTENGRQKTDSRETKETENTDSISSPRSKEGTDVWKELIERVKTHNHSIAGVLRGCSLQSFSKEKVVIGTSFKFHKERLEDRKVREVLENVFHEMMGSKVNIEILLKQV